MCDEEVAELKGSEIMSHECKMSCVGYEASGQTGFSRHEYIFCFCSSIIRWLRSVGEVVMSFEKKILGY